MLKPEFVDQVTSEAIDQYVATRMEETAYVRGDRMSPATVNKELRHIKAAMDHARRWKMIQASEVPEFDMLREPVKEKRNWEPEEFAAAYEACEIATQPAGYSFQPADWWRCLFVLGWMTG